MTNLWADIKNTDLVVIMGGNAAEAHPCGFKWVTEAKHHKKAKLIVVDPRFTRSAAMSDLHIQIRPGTDIAFLGGVIKYLLDNDKLQKEYVLNYTNAPYILRVDFKFEDGLFSGYDEAKRDYNRASWEYELGDDGFVKADMTLQDPRCVFQVMKAHFARYTAEMVERITGASKDRFLEACKWIAETSAPDKVMTSMYALGWTQHSKGSQNIRTMAMIQLLLGNIGMAGGGMNALRGHSNIQGLTDIGLMSNLIPGYLTLPSDTQADFAAYMKPRGFKPLRPGQTSFWQNYEKFFVSFMKAMWGPAATKENDWAYDYLPKLDVPAYDVLRAWELMHQGKMNGYFCQGFNPLMSFPNRRKLQAALEKLKFLVVMDPLPTETSEFWQNHGEHNPADPAKIQTEVFRLPTSVFAEEEGSLTNSGRWLQWHWKGADSPGEAKTDIEIIARIFGKVRELYRKDGGAFADPLLKVTWDYEDPLHPRADELARELNGRALADVPDPRDPAKLILRKGQQLSGFGEMRNDGTTMGGCWIYSGCWTEAGNQMARRDNSDPGGLGLTPKWAWSWPANRRILYNRASADLKGNPWNPKQKQVWWNGERWAGYDVPDYGPLVKPEAGVSPFIMNQEGTARLFTRGLMRDGPFPEHYEPFEAPVANALHPRVGPSPVARVFKGDMEQFGKVADFPIVATTYRLTEHFHFWSKHVRINASTQPQEFIELGEELAKEKGIASGDLIEVRSNRGRVKAVAVVTKRIKALKVDGKTVHTVGIPLHWGFTGETKKGFGCNQLTPYVGDANIETPEYKAFLVDVKKLGTTAA